MSKNLFLAICALLNVRASYLKVGQGVIRVDLKRHFVEDNNLQIEDDIDPDKLLLEGVEAPVTSQNQLLVD